MSIIIFLIILLVLVISHEFGHFIVAKKAGIRVDEFAFGFKPRLFSIKKGETRYSFNLLPIGGYVSIYGENPDEESINGPDKDRSFVNKPKYIQALVMIAGVVMNFLVAWLLISVGFMTGLPSSVDNAPAGSNIENVMVTVTSVIPGSPAEKAGIKVRDRIQGLSSGVDTSEAPSFESVQYFIRQHPQDEINFSVLRGDEIKEVKMTPIQNESNSAIVGISMDRIGTLKLPVHEAIWSGLKLSLNLTKATFMGFYHLIHDAIVGKGDFNSISGPVGIVGIVGDAASFGFVYLLSFTALISINLAVINLIPFPALDGGRLLFLLIEKIKGSRIKPQVANMINLVGFGLLMLLMLVVTYHDIVKLL